MFTRWRRKILVLSGVAAMALTSAGCSITDEGYIKYDNVRLGEWTYSDGGALAVLYRRSGSGYVATTDILLAQYRDRRNRGYSIEGASRSTLYWASRYCSGGYSGDRCRDATSGDEWADFHEALTKIATYSGECLAVFFRSGENWTTRSQSDRHCVP